MMSQMEQVRVGVIEVGERHRALSEPDVERLMSSMREMGLRQPITIRVVDEMEIDGHIVSGVPLLVAGRHRLESAKRLGWSHIDCIEVEDDALMAELWEIAENLHRLDLTKDQRDEHIRRYAELLEAKRLVPQNAAPVSILPDGRRKGPQHEKAIPRQIAEETGLSVDTVRRALNPKPAPEPKAPLADHDVVTVQFNALMAAWNRACSDARSMFIDNIDGAL